MPQKKKRQKPLPSAAVGLKSAGSTVDDLDEWAREMYAWLQKVYVWFLAVHNTCHPHNLLDVPVQKPPEPPPYPPR